MRVTKGLFFILAALVGVLVLAAPANAQSCTDPDKAKFRDGLDCLRDLGAKWNQLIHDLSLLNGKLGDTVDEINEACGELGSEDDCPDPTSASEADLDFDRAKTLTDDAAADVELSLTLVESIVAEINDFTEEVTGLAGKLDGAGTDFPFRDRTRTSAARFVDRIGKLAGKVLDRLGDAATNTGIAGFLASAQKDLEDASAELDTESPQEDVAVPLLRSALVGGLNKAITSKGAVLSRFLTQVRKDLDSLVRFFKLGIRGGSRATSVGFVAQSNIQAKVYTLSGQLVSVGAASALSQSSLANGVYVVVYSTGRVEKLVVLH